LWIGSQPRPRAAGHFDVIVLCAEELQNIPLQGAHVVKAPLDDYKPTAREVQTALSAARTVHILRKRGNRASTARRSSPRSRSWPTACPPRRQSTASELCASRPTA
jgi:hypothetical protein